MIEQYHHKLTNSFLLWFDNYLLEKGEAYTNKTGVSLQNYKDDRSDSSYEVYGSPFKQWVIDSSINGATIPNGITVGNTPTAQYNPTTQSRDGYAIDFDNGRVLVEGSDSNLNITCDFAVKDFNVYFTNETEEDLINLMEFYKPDVRILGDDYIGKRFTGDHMPIEVIYTTRSHNWSTTRIKDLITKQTILQNPSIIEENVKSLTADEAAKIINNK